MNSKTIEIKSLQLILLLMLPLYGICQRSVLHINHPEGGYYNGRIFEFGDTLIIPMQGNYKLVSYDQGRTWKRDVYNIEGTTGYEVFLNSKVVYRSQFNDILKSTDGGSTWQLSFSGKDKNIIDLSLLHIGYVNGKLRGLALEKVDGKVFNRESLYLSNFEIYKPLYFFEENDHWIEYNTPALILALNSSVHFSRSVISGHFNSDGRGMYFLNIRGGYNDGFPYAHIGEISFGFSLSLMSYPVHYGESCNSGFTKGDEVFLLYITDEGQKLKVYTSPYYYEPKKVVKYRDMKWEMISNGFKKDSESLAPFTLYYVDAEQIK